MKEKQRHFTSLAQYLLSKPNIDTSLKDSQEHTFNTALLLQLNPIQYPQVQFCDWGKNKE